MRTALTALSVLALAGIAAADFTYPTIAGPSNANASGEFTLNLGDAPAATYESATISATFNDLGGARAGELRMGFGNSGVGGPIGNFFYTAFAAAIPGATTAAGDQSLSWTMNFANDFAGGAGNDLFFNGYSAFIGTWAFSDLSITLNAAPTLESLSLSTLVAGDMANGDTRTSDNDLTGNQFVSPFGGGGVNGGDDVYRIDWAGGDFDATLDILSDGGAPLFLPAELDMYLYDSAEPSSALAFSNQGNSGGDPDTLSLAGLAAGTYYLRVDGLFDSGAYRLSIAPAPGAIALLGLSGLAGIRRRRA